MPISQEIDHQRRLVLTRAAGLITFSDMLKHIQEEASGAGLEYPEVIDARGAEPSFTAAEVRQAVATLRTAASGSRPGPTAIVVDSDVGFGIARMLGLLLDDLCVVRPFRDRDSADEWLRSVSATAGP